MRTTVTSCSTVFCSLGSRGIQPLPLFHPFSHPVNGNGQRQVLQCLYLVLKSGMLPGPLVLMVQLTGTSFKRLTSRILPGLPGFETSRKRPQRPQPRWKHHHANHVVTVATNGKTWHNWLVHFRYVTIVCTLNGRICMHCALVTNKLQSPAGNTSQNCHRCLAQSWGTGDRHVTQHKTS